MAIGRSDARRSIWWMLIEMDEVFAQDKATVSERHWQLPVQQEQQDEATGITLPHHSSYLH